MGSKEISLEIRGKIARAIQTTPCLATLRDDLTAYALIARHCKARKPTEGNQFFFEEDVRLLKNFKKNLFCKLTQLQRNRRLLKKEREKEELCLINLLHAIELEIPERWRTLVENEHTESSTQFLLRAA